jgi:hypothetical protein
MQDTHGKLATEQKHYQLATLAYVLKHVFQMLRSVSSILSSGNAAHTCLEDMLKNVGKRG